MISDANKGISNITYNYMNLPEVITFSTGNKMVYTYDAAGTKLSQKTYPACGGSGVITQYSGGFVYEDNTLAYFPFSEGRVRKVKPNITESYRYEYDLTDHLGNVRATFAAIENYDSDSGNSFYTPQLLQADSYYPFGMKMGGYSYVASGGAENKFTYNGKELEDEFGLDWYHYGARYYDPVIGRWWATDPAEEFHSPYTYVGNNPIMLIDPDGMMSDDPPSTCIGFSCMSGEAMSRMFTLATTMSGSGLGNTDGLMAFGLDVLGDFSTTSGYLSAAGTSILKGGLDFYGGRGTVTFLPRFSRFSFDISYSRVQGWAGNLKNLGRVVGVGSLLVTATQVSNGYISQSEGIGDGIFGFTSLLGVPGAVISSPYFGFKALFENDKIPFNDVTGFLDNPNKRSMYPSEIFGNRTPRQSWQLLKKHSWLGDVFDN